MQSVHFERAIFISWYCSKRDCAFCYLSSKTNPQSPIKDRRSLSSILAEAVICKACGWKVEFISGGCDTYTDKELLEIIKGIYEITGQKQWLNLGILTEKQLNLFKPYIEGVCGTVECITPGLRDKLCPSKPLKDIEQMFRIAEKLGLKKTITLIVGLGETIEDFKNLKSFIEKNTVGKLTFYRLKPQKGTVFENTKGPDTDYYVRWIKNTRQAFPNIHIVVGSWLTHLDEIHLLLKAGANSITKFPSIKQFNSKYARQIEQEVHKAGMKFEGTLTKVPKITLPHGQLKDKLKAKIDEYISQMD